MIVIVFESPFASPMYLCSPETCVHKLSCSQEGSH
uniref:Uncharacterized protein n=1 Tax=Anguilla anguilla TaxID=7936 RepID=A0A0E9RHL9_ANGAN